MREAKHGQSERFVRRHMALVILAACKCRIRPNV
jgi:hypothetical protein